ncbi:O-antigen/teichoic acid export membrane protein [Mucilaginibacter yixingensis]|uniref:O-antigen/teichoic acid export membrane protein n=1 Tax=Mucilaginibacter yixingensis TaxID=1295612 RepID=A0A2T5JGR6_9SPHI|nr:flippase [Mucilaginibacter yixingensis]PTR01584.1 O-antigen/teichoic acid export membrane protein [Mucilaginibacter yixingensis]
MLKKNLFFNILLSASQFLFPLISFPYVSRILGPSGIGTVNFIDSFTQYFILFAALGIPYYGVREIAKVKDDPSELDKIFSQILIIHVTSTILFSIIYLGAALIIPSLNEKLHLVLIGILIMFFNILSLEWFFQAIGNFSYITIRTIIIKSVSLLLLFLCFKKGASPTLYYLLTASVFVFNGISNLLFIKGKFKFIFNTKDIKKHFKPLVIILSSTLAISVYVLFDNVILGFMKDTTTVGIYSTAVRIVKIPLVFVGAISTIIIPQISKAYNEQQQEVLKSLIQKSYTFICVVSIPMCVGLYISSEFLIYTFAGKQFIDSIMVLKLLCPIVFIIGLSNLFGIQLLTPAGKEKYLLKAVIIGMICSFALNLLLIPSLSFIGSCIANIVAEIAVTLSAYIYAKKFFDFSMDFKTPLLSLIVALLFIPISFVIRELHLQYITKECLVIAINAIFYVMTLAIVSKNVFIKSVVGLTMKKLRLVAGE